MRPTQFLTGHHSDEKTEQHQDAHNHSHSDLQARVETLAWDCPVEAPSALQTAVRRVTPPRWAELSMLIPVRDDDDVPTLTERPITRLITAK